MEGAHVVGRRPQRGRALSPREREVLAWLLRGLSRTDIAQRLRVSPETVKTQQASIYRKLGVAGRFAVAAWVWKACPEPAEGDGPVGPAGCVTGKERSAG
jgi:DNA-binding CsgD family transcriptional regulator